MCSDIKQSKLCMMVGSENNIKRCFCSQRVVVAVTNSHGASLAGSYLAASISMLLQFNSHPIEIHCYIFCLNDLLRWHSFYIHYIGSDMGYHIIYNTKFYGTEQGVYIVSLCLA